MAEGKRRIALCDYPATGCIADTMTEAHRLARNAVKEQWRARDYGRRQSKPASLQKPPGPISISTETSLSAVPVQIF